MCSKSNLITPSRSSCDVLDPFYRTNIRIFRVAMYLYPLFSITFRYRTNNPLEVNITIVNSMPIGGLLHAFLCVSLDNVASPENEYSAPPENLVILPNVSIPTPGRDEVLPFNDILASFPFCATMGATPFSVGGVKRCGNSHENICGVQLAREICFYRDFVGNFCA